MQYFSSLKLDELKTMVEYLSDVEFAKGDLIVKEGDPGDGCYLIESGRIRLELAGQHPDSEVVLGYLEQGMALGEFSLIDKQPRSASAYADTAVTARKLTTKAFERICKDHPALGNKLLNFLSRELAHKMRIANKQLRNFMVTEKLPPWVDAMVAASAKAQALFADWPEQKVDALLGDIGDTMCRYAGELGEASVWETGFGVVAHKIDKIHLAVRETLTLISGRPGAGLLKTDSKQGVDEIAAAMGVIFGIIPLTNPVPTIAFKVLISLKSRNALIFSCHRNAMGVGNRTGMLIRDVLQKHGAPVDLVSWIKERGSRSITSMFMTHPKVDLILATGGPGMVKAAYTSGTPAIGVGCGNAPVLICADADPDKTAKIIIQSKSFDNGVICGSENNLVVDSAIRAQFIKALERNGAAVLSRNEVATLTEYIIDPETGSLKRALVGQSAMKILSGAGLYGDKKIKLIVAPVAKTALKTAWGGEMLAPIISLFTANDIEDGMDICLKILNNMGAGHTAIIHTRDKALVRKFALRMPVARILHNCAGSTGCIGVGNGLRISFTLGCGSWGHTSTTDNVNYDNLMNIKRVAAAL